MTRTRPIRAPCGGEGCGGGGGVSTRVVTTVS